MATFTVTTLADSGAGSLRQAVEDANGALGADTIVFSVSGQINLTSQLALTDDVTIDGDINGDNKADIIISGGDTTRIFQQSGTLTDVALLSLTLTNGFTNTGLGTTSGGGAIQASGGTLLIVDTTIQNSRALYGGGIKTNGTFTTITNSLITGNLAYGFGGGIYVNGGLIMTNTTVHGNSSTKDGGGLHLANAISSISISNSTITSNRSNADGSNSTYDGGGISNTSVYGVTIRNSVVADNFAGTGVVESDVNGIINTATHSVFGTDVNITNATNVQESVANVGLGTLALHGGTTATRNIETSAVLFNAGTNTGVHASDANGNARIEGGTVDIGATEFQSVLTVTNLNDSGAGSLRQAVLDANASTGIANSIVFAAGLSGTITLTSGELRLNDDVTIDGDTNGDNRADITISGNNASSIFRQYGATTDVDLLSLTLTGGNALSFYGLGGYGGAIWTFDSGTLDIVDTTITGNSGYRTGGIFANGTTVSLLNSLVSFNASTTLSNFSDSGGIRIINDTLTLVNTTIHENSTNGAGGGIHADGATLQIINSTITNNHADVNGSATNQGGGLRVATSTTTITNSVIADNTSGGATENDVSGTITTATTSVFGTTTSVGAGTQAGVAEVGLGTLALHGGTIATRNIISPTSVLINTGTNIGVSVSDANGNARIDGGTVDIGATEYQTTITVTNLNDSGAGSLRQAVLDANSSAGIANSIVFANGLSGTITLTGGELQLSDSVTIDGDTNGDNRADIIVSGNNASRIFNQSGVNTDVALRSLTLTNGNSQLFQGGAIFADQGTLTITDTTIQNNQGSNGGGIHTSLTVTTITNSLIADNFSTSRGGGISAYGASLTMTNSTVTGNSANYLGGGIVLGEAVLANIRNTTITENRANADGIGVAFLGGGIAHGYSYSGSVNMNLVNTVVADNFAGSGTVENDIFGPVNMATTSVFGTAVTITNGVGNEVGVANVGLGELLDNGGTTATRNIVSSTSVLINAGTNTGVVSTTDANGNPRVFDGIVDIGATEYGSAPIVVTTANALTLQQESLALYDTITVSGFFPDFFTTVGAGLLYYGMHHTFAFTAGNLVGGVAPAWGQLVSINQNQPLLSVLGFDYGSTTTHFALPNTSLRQSVGAGQGDGLTNHLLAERFGSATATLTTTVLPSSLGGGLQTFDDDGRQIAERYMIATNAFAPQTGSGEARTDFTGSIIKVAFDFEFLSYMECDGRLLAISQFAALYAVIGTTYGGDGVTTFAIPDLRGRTPIGAGDDFVLGSYVGQEDVTIADANLPANMGGMGVPISNMEPSLAVNFFISHTGNFPGGSYPDDGKSLLGEIITFAGAGTPDGFFACDGQLLSTAVYPELFAAIGNTFGGDGVSNFALPDLRNRSIVGAGISGFELRELGNIQGSNTITLTSADFPDLNYSGDEFNGVHYGADGKDTIRGLNGDDTLIGGLGADILDGGSNTAAGDTLSYDGSLLGVSINLLTGLAQAGDAEGDTFTGFENVTGSALGDQLIGDDGANVLRGGLGNDTIYGDGGDDTLIGGGHDVGGWNTLVGGAGFDTADYSAETGIVYADLSLSVGYINNGAGFVFNDALQQFENLIGGAGNDALSGDDTANLINGRGGNDVMFGKGGDDTMIGGGHLVGGYDVLYGDAGIDTMSFAEVSSQVYADLLIGSPYGVGYVNTGAGFVHDSLFFAFENIIGGAGNDILQGDNNANTLTGGDGADFMLGQGGNDTLIGGIGNDSLYGGAGNDRFVFDQGLDIATGGADADTFYWNSMIQGADVVSDFSHAEGDKINLDHAVFGVPTAWGLILGANFFVGAGAAPTQATASISFDTTSNILWYDIDGTGVSGRQAITFLSNGGGGITAGDILFV